MNYNIFLDDDRNPSDVKWIELPKVDWVVVRSYDQFRSLILSRLNGNGDFPAHVSLDHDLSVEHYLAAATGDETKKFKEKTGFDCARFLVEFCLDSKREIPMVTAHSLNPVGRENILKLIDWGRRVQETYE